MLTGLDVQGGVIEGVRGVGFPDEVLLTSRPFDRWGPVDAVDVHRFVGDRWVKVHGGQRHAQVLDAVPFGEGGLLVERRDKPAREERSRRSGARHTSLRSRLPEGERRGPAPAAPPARRGSCPPRRGWGLGSRVDRQRWVAPSRLHPPMGTAGSAGPPLHQIL